MNKSNSIELFDRANLTEQTKFRSEKIVKLKIIFMKKLKKIME